MPVARIFSESASDAAPLIAHLHALGYTIEIAPLTSDVESHADLEIRLTRCSRADALAEAERHARELGADIYIAGGALRLAEPEAVDLEPEPEAELEQHAPAGETNFSMLRDPLAPVAHGMQPEAQAYTAQAAEAPPVVSEVPPFVSEDEIDRAMATGELEPVIALESSDQPANAALDAVALPDEAETTNDFALFGAELSQPEANASDAVPATPIRWGASLPKKIGSLGGSTRQLFRKSIGALAGYRQQMMQNLRVSRHARVQRAQETPAASALAASPPAPAQQEISSPPPAVRNADQRVRYTARPLPWTAFASAGAIAVAVLLGWSVLTGRSATPNVPINGNIEQQIPFGPVKIVPRSLPSQLPAVGATPVSVTAREAASPRASGPTSSSKPTAVKKPKTTTRHVARRRIHRGEQIAEDEVIVHHYTLPKPPTQAKVSSTSIKHISDQE